MNNGLGNMILSLNDKINNETLHHNNDKTNPIDFKDHHTKY